MEFYQEQYIITIGCGFEGCHAWCRFWVELMLHAGVLRVQLVTATGLLVSEVTRCGPCALAWQFPV
jgi:hypothetical protein